MREGAVNLIRYAEYGIRVARNSRRRYRNLFTLIARSRARRILEIGTWNGRHARDMIRTASVWHDPATVQYFGFDLFEQSTADDLAKEFTPKIPPREDEVRQYLAATGASVTLYKGYTRDTLPRVAGSLPVIDFAFIDGGHSIETVRGDWAVVQTLVRPHSVVVFDDYYQIDDRLKDLGCRPVIEELDRDRYDIEVLEPAEVARLPSGTLRIQMVVVRPRPGTGHADHTPLVSSG
jgi:predicted O-methyltransferase YrrM